jgi:hypothetical protein
MSLFEEGQAEVKPKSTCTVCAFVASRAEPGKAKKGEYDRDEWTAYIDSDESAAIVYRVMLKHGYTGSATDGPLRNHRTGHRQHLARKGK